MHEFRVWAPNAKQVAVEVDGQRFPMLGPSEQGSWKVMVESAEPGTRYGFLLDDDPQPYPDPRSLLQPDGVHGLSALFDQHTFQWTDEHWQGPPLAGAVIYELHIGTFTERGTFDSAIERLPFLEQLGVTHLEIMPIVEWAGDRGWGYDGVDLYAVTQNYGGPEAFKRFVDACHRHCLGVVLDVVYNHFGPVGNYTGRFGPYTSDVHHTPWGVAINFERKGSDEVRRFFIDNALMWMHDFHVDGLRLDAIHEIMDRSAIHFLEQLSADVAVCSTTLGRKTFLIAESDLNNPCIVRPIEANGYGMDAQWSDDFHHALATILYTNPGHGGYYDDFGAFGSLAKAARDIFVFDGQYSKYRGHSHGRPIDNLSAHRFINFLQNHDQIGNRAFGDRVHHAIGIPRTKAALGLVLTAPMVPMLFMGEEFAASTPFLYFADHNDPDMAKLVSEGRKREFASFGFEADDIPNPEDVSTFNNSKLNWNEVSEGEHADMLEYVRRLIRIRRHSPSLNDGDRGHVRIGYSEEKRWLRLDRGQVAVLVNFGPEPASFDLEPEYQLLLENGVGVEWQEGRCVLQENGFALLSREE